MAHPTQRVVRWQKYKQRGRKRRFSKAFVNKGLGGPSPALMNQYGGLTAYRIRDRFIGLTDMDVADLCNLWKLADFSFMDWRERGDKRLDVEIKISQLQQSRTEYRVLDFNYIYLREGDPSGDVRLFFGGNEYFIIERRGNVLKRSIMYSDKDTAIRKYELGRITWAGTGIRNTSARPP